MYSAYNIVSRYRFSAYRHLGMIKTFNNYFYLKTALKIYFHCSAVRPVLGVHRRDDLRAAGLVQGHNDRSDGPDVSDDLSVRAGPQR